MNMPDENRDEAERALLSAIKERLPQLRALLAKVSTQAYAEDAFFRFYRQSSKVYWLQEHTREIVAALRSLAPGRPLHEWFEKVVGDVTGRESQPEHGLEQGEARRIMEAFFHARTMLEFAVRYGAELDGPPRRIPSGWAAVLYLYGLR